MVVLYLQSTQSVAAHDPPSRGRALLRRKPRVGITIFAGGPLVSRREQIELRGPPGLSALDTHEVAATGNDRHA